MMDPVRLEALKLAVEICGHGNYPDVGTRCDASLKVADLYVLWLNGSPPQSEAAADAIDARKAG